LLLGVENVTPQLPAGAITFPYHQISGAALGVRVFGGLEQNVSVGGHVASGQLERAQTAINAALPKSADCRAATESGAGSAGREESAINSVEVGDIGASFGVESGLEDAVGLVYDAPYVLSGAQRGDAENAEDRDVEGGVHGFW